MSQPEDDRKQQLHPVPLLGVLLVGVFFVAVGMHFRSDNPIYDRSSRHLYQIAIGSILISFAVIELVRYAWSKRT